MRIEQLSQINKTLQELLTTLNKPFYHSPEFWVIITALIVGIGTPLLTEFLRRRPEKSSLVVDGSSTTNHVNEFDDSESPISTLLEVGRIRIKNIGKFKARSVEAYIEQIFDNDEERKEFFPMPLFWTHGQLNKSGPTVRDIYPNQTVYLDIFNFIKDEEYTTNRTVLLAVAAGVGVDNLSKLALGESELHIKIYQESGQVNEVKIKLAWNGRNVPLISVI